MSIVSYVLCGMFCLSADHIVSLHQLPVVEVFWTVSTTGVYL